MRHLLTPFVLVAALAAEPAVINAPAEISFFDAPRVTITGLAAMHPVTVRATTIDAKGRAFTSVVRFVPDVSGTVDTARSLATGHYEGADAMGLFWSARGPDLFDIPVSGPVRTTIQVEDDAGATMGSTTLSRVLLPANVRVTDLRPPAAPFVGRLYEHPPGRPRAGIVSLAGSVGGIDSRMAPWLASQGYDVLALGYFHGEGLPEHLIEIPLEYFRGALEWLAARQSGRRPAVVGHSKGAEAALLLAAYFPESVRAIALFAPTHVVWEGADARARMGGDPRFDAPGRSSWTLRGTPLPFVRKTITPARLARRPVAFLDAYAPSLERGVEPAALIPLDRLRAAVFMASGGDDLAWPATRMAREIRTRLEKQGRGVTAEHWDYPVAGHVFGLPGVPSTVAFGGTLSGNAHAAADAWARLAKFLRVQLAGN